ncbi:23S rRNA (guanosine(2251)-2'-O)-methyltransferase RlmB [candidate division TM6 bacterium RIFCSPHIGHO2_12_FULL_36_22]|nr:MAG: 23S rRNA (guanosine(2251)-2'-O)-methyltransferase RlmB [candidate division TM6 bacterium RIFCSPHIGHO2_12_FULL_36_22]
MKNTIKKQELVFGVHPLIELLKAKKRKLYTLYTTKPEPKAFAQLKKYWPKYPVNIQYVKREALHKLADSTDHQGFVAYAAPLQINTQFFNPEIHKNLVLLDGIQDPRNLGAIIRSAYCTGIDGIILCSKNSAPLTAAAIKASAGLAEHANFYIVPSIKAALELLKQAGYNIYLTTLDNGTNALTVEYKQPLCLVIGNEEKGISKETFGKGTKITLPQKTSDISYNASVAAGIFMFLIMNQK